MQQQRYAASECGVCEMKKRWEFLRVNLGSLLFALAYILFFEHLKMTPGGLGGLSIILGQLTGISFGKLNVALNIPAILLGLYFLGTKRICLTAYAVFLSSAFIDLGTWVIPPVNCHIAVATLFGGMLQGAGVGVLFSAGASIGGTALIGQLVQLMLPEVKMGNILLVVDGSIVLLNLLVFRDVKLAAVSLFAIFVSTKMIDFLLKRKKEGGRWSRLSNKVRCRRSPRKEPAQAR